MPGEGDRKAISGNLFHRDRCLDPRGDRVLLAPPLSVGDFVSLPKELGMLRSLCLAAIVSLASGTALAQTAPAPKAKVKAKKPAPAPAPAPAETKADPAPAQPAATAATTEPAK